MTLKATSDSEHGVIEHSAAARVKSDAFSVNQGGIGRVDAGSLETHQSGIGFCTTQTAEIMGSQTALLIAHEGVEIDHSATSVVAAKQDVSMEKCVAGIVVANEIQAQNSRSVFMVARSVTGNVRSLFGVKETLLFASVIGLVLGLLSIFAGNIGACDD